MTAPAPALDLATSLRGDLNGILNIGGGYNFEEGGGGVTNLNREEGTHKFE